MLDFVQQLVSGIALGCVYGLIALGFVLVYKATEVVNFAQGDLMMLGGFFAFTFISLLGFNYWLGFVLLTRVDVMTTRFGESVGEYASGAVRRFANLAGSEDWLGLMNVLERATDPGAGCLTYMVGWSLKQDEAPPASHADSDHAHAGCTCGGSGGCS